MGVLARLHPTGTWILEHTGNNHHNHEAAKHSGACPTHRKRTTETNALIHSQRQAGATVKTILSMMQQEDPNCVFTGRDIHNSIALGRRNALGDRTAMHALLDVLHTSGFFFRYEVFPLGTDLPEAGHIKYIFFAHPGAIDIYKANHDVVLMDCTYKTNVYNYPLLNIIGTTGMNTSVQIGLVFLASEREEDYAWAMQQFLSLIVEHGIPPPSCFVTDRELALKNALSATFPEVPQILCIWHVNKNVAAHVKRSFPPEIDLERSTPRTRQYKDSEQFNQVMTAYFAIVNATSISEYEDKLRAMEVIDRDTTGYLKLTYLDHWRNGIVKAFTNLVAHFGNTATSRNEGFHHVLKDYTQSSKNDVYSLFERLSNMWVTQHREHHIAVAQVQFKIVLCALVRCLLNECD